MKTNSELKFCTYSLFYRMEEGTSEPFLPSSLYFMVILDGSSLTALSFPSILWIALENFF